MENEAELGKGEHTDDGYSEKKTDKQVDLLVRSRNAPTQGGNVFTLKKNSQTVFQAQNEEKK